VRASSTSTTIDPAHAASRGWLAAALAALALAWGALIATAPADGPVAVVGPPAPALAAVVAAGGLVVEARDYSIIARSDDPAFRSRLSAQGFVLVLPARPSGCLSTGKRRV
jgi:hypothetical protein